MFPAIVIARRAHDGLVFLSASDDPAADLRLANVFGVEIEQYVITPRSQHARTIASAIARRFDAQRVEREGYWFAVEYSRALCAVGEFNLETGRQHAAGRVGLGAPVVVDGIGSGRVTGFSECGRIEVDCSTSKFASRIVYAPASLVGPA